MHEHVPLTRLTVEAHQALVALPETEDGQDVTVYYVEQVQEDNQPSLPPASQFFGVWADLDPEETFEALDRIRHESTPTPPIEL